jgi:hypothetical protein
MTTGCNGTEGERRVSFHHKKHLGSWHLRSDGILREKGKG